MKFNQNMILRKASLLKSNHNNNYILAFSSKADALDCLNQTKELLSEDLQMASEIISSASTSYGFLVSPDQWNKIRKLVREQSNNLRPAGDFYFKTIRNDSYNYYHRFVEELVDSSVRYKKR